LRARCPRDDPARKGLGGGTGPSLRYPRRHQGAGAADVGAPPRHGSGSGVRRCRPEHRHPARSERDSRPAVPGAAEHGVTMTSAVPEPARDAPQWAPPSAEPAPAPERVTGREVLGYLLGRAWRAVQAVATVIRPIG